MVIYLNGKWVEEEEASLSILDRGFVFADAIYEVLHSYQGVIFQTEAHIRRLQRGLQFLKIPFETAILPSLFEEALSRNQIQDEGMIYLQISRGAAIREHGLPKGLEPTVVLYAKPLKLDRKNALNGIRAVFYEDIRWQLCHLKTTGLLVNCMAKEYALEHGVQDVIFHREEVVTEASSSNLFLVKEGSLYTHPNSNWILPGITREVVIALALENQISVYETAFTKMDLLQAEEVFLTSTINEILPIVEVDSQAIGQCTRGPITQKLQEAFENITRRRS